MRKPTRSPDVKATVRTSVCALTFVGRICTPGATGAPSTRPIVKFT